MRLPFVIAILLAAAAAVFAGNSAFVRVNQVGYVSNAPKRALLMASVPGTGATFAVKDSSGTVVHAGVVGASLGAWSPRKYPYVYALDFDAVSASGTYSIQVSGKLKASSPQFRVDSGANLYGPLLPNIRAFFLAQRDGANVDPSVLSRQPSHLTDSSALIYESPVYVDGLLQGDLTTVGGPIDASGGWFDAGDYLKFVETASYTNAVMLMAVRDYPALYANDPSNFAVEAKFGLDWLQKMWDDATLTLYYQVGLGDGNGSTIAGDHDYWRLPEADDQLSVTEGDPNYYVKYRPVFRAGPPGSPISPNLAGRLAADFALCFQVYRATDPAYADQCLFSAQHVYDLALTSGVAQLLTAAPYDYYPETEWRDDMELGATELYFAVAGGSLPPGLPHADPLYYLQQAANWAGAYMLSPYNGTDTLNLYDVSGLAHHELYRAITQAGNPAGLAVTRDDLVGDLKDQLDAAVALSAGDPFGLGYVYRWGDVTPHALGLVLEAGFYDELTASSSYAGFGRRQLDFLLGSNAWGSSFVVGAGSTFPHCLQHQVANLSGALDGSFPILLGAVVNGPTLKRDFRDLGVPDGALSCPADGIDLFRRFTGKRARYLDSVAAWPSVEPADDYTALTLLVFARQTE